jgi:multiple sugar transport system permease protein
MRSSPLVRALPAVVAAVIFLLPLWFMIAGSLRAAGQPPAVGLEALLPGSTLDSYARLPQLIPLGLYVRNSVLVTSIAVPLTILTASLAGFAIRTATPRRRRLLVIGCVAALMIPVTAVWATRFELFRLAGIIDTQLPLIAPAVAATSPFFVLIYAWTFGGISDSQLAAARLEGTGAWRLYWRIAMPQVKPATLAVGVLSFALHWGNFIDALLYLQSQDHLTLPLGIRFLQLLNPTDWQLLMAGCVIMTVPSVLVFLLAQRLFLDDPLRALRRTTA